MKTIKKSRLFFLASALFISGFCFSQIGIGTTTPALSSIIDLTSDSAGFLPSRMTYVQRNAIAAPVAGLIVWCSNCGASGEMQVYNGTTWTNISGAAGSFAVPSAPLNPQAIVAGIEQASISFSAPTSSGGTAITGYTVTSNPGNKTASGLTSPISVLNLTSGVSYTFTVVATNSIGNSVASVSTNTAVPNPAIFPDAPTNVVATPGTATASVAFTAPIFNGGRNITGYTATSTPGNFSVSGATSPITVTGLSNGTNYTFTVVATNVIGSSVASIASASVRTNTVPDAPTNVVATPGTANASVAFTAPVLNGGTAITGYTVTSTPGNFSASGATSPITVTGLSNGTNYTFTVVATNVIGSSVASIASASVRTNTIPYAPTTVTASSTISQKATVTFTTPASNGGSAIIDYTVTSNPDGFTATYTSSPITVTGLTNGTAYTFWVVARNSVGNSVASSPSNSVTPIVTTIPDAPTNVVATRGYGTASIGFTAPASNGGTAIIDYTVTSNPTTSSVTSTTFPITVTGLTYGTSYTFTVVARNAVGNSVASSNSNAVIPANPANAICDGTLPTNVVEITSPTTGKTWMDRNLGASRSANSTLDYMAYGCLYQWGRGNDGHASMNYTWSHGGALTNGTTTTTSDTPGNALFILNAADWRVSPNNSLWQGVNGTNNPCPAGFRIPTYTEFLNEFNAYNITNTNSAFSNGPSGGFKFPATPEIYPSNSFSIGYAAGSLWTSTVQSLTVSISDFGISYYSGQRSIGASVRCIKN